MSTARMTLECTLFNIILHTSIFAVTAILLSITPITLQAEETIGPGSSWAEYDFVPGKQLLFFEDFTGTGARAPMRRLQRVSSRIAVQTRGNAPGLLVRPPGTFEIALPTVLPEKFTIDFDFYNEGSSPILFRSNASGGDEIQCGNHTVAAGSGEDGGPVEIDRISGLEEIEKRINHCSVAVDGQVVRIYVNQVRVLNRKAAFGRSQTIFVEIPGVDDPTYIDQTPPFWIANLRIAAGGPELSYNELISRGRIALQGILFDTGSDRIRPESTPTMAAIAAMLREHADLRLTVEGHTDNVGTVSANQTLSERRAAAVKALLTKAWGISADRLQTTGYGSTRPAATNDTAEGRQSNRRVELVRLN